MDISHDADILLSHLQEVGGHLVQQGTAKVIHPVILQAKYRINPEAHIKPICESVPSMSTSSSSGFLGEIFHWFQTKRRLSKNLKKLYSR